MGLSVEDYPRPEVILWAENWEVIRFYTQNATQWRVGAAGAVGLDYNVFFHELDRMGLTPDEYDDLMGGIRVIESSVLEINHR